ncbi:MAG: hypothetical protein R3C59_10265 [Planctomycetaceae bacterium]
MSAISQRHSDTSVHDLQRSTFIFVIGFLLFAIAALTMTTTAPIGMSVLIVILFAGPHNYVEARYFLTRLPRRLGPLKRYFLYSAAGIVILTVTYPLLAHVPDFVLRANRSGIGSRRAAFVMVSVGIWNTALIFWCAGLAALRSSQRPYRNWDYKWPIAFGVAGAAWLQPLLLPLLLVFAHPLMGLWLLDREILFRRPHWSFAYRLCVATVPVMLIMLWTLLPVGVSDLWPDIHGVERQIARHVGAPLFSPVISKRLIASHAFLELLHYGVWIVAIPVASGRVFSKPFQAIPLLRRSGLVRSIIRIGLIVGLAAVIALWLFFQADYSTTRDVYFAIAMLHVLAEIPFLLRML